MERPNTSINEPNQPLRKSDDCKGMYRDLSKLFYDPTGQGQEGDKALMQKLNNIKEQIEKGENKTTRETGKQELRALYLEWCSGELDVEKRIRAKLAIVSERMNSEYHTKWLKQGTWAQREHLIKEYKKICDEEGVDYDSKFIQQYCEKEHGLTFYI